jgi:hypothetical protein
MKTWSVVCDSPGLVGALIIGRFHREMIKFGFTVTRDHHLGLFTVSHEDDTSMAIFLMTRHDNGIKISVTEKQDG